MCALAQKIELRGIATAVIALIRPHAEAIRNPRSLWVPFQLGRPLGEPEDAAFQSRVLQAALALLERGDGPVILEDHREDAPGWIDQPGWRSPFEVMKPSTLPATPDAWAAALASEIARVAPHWEAARARRGRTTVGPSGQPPVAWAAYAARFLGGEVPASPVPLLPTPALALRFLVDDLKAYYGEAAQSSGPPPAARQVDQWFWRETLAGAFLQVLRNKAMASDNNGLKTVGGRFFVPAPYVVA